MADFEILRERTLCYDLPGFRPIEITEELLRSQGVDYPLTDDVKRQLKAGYDWYCTIFKNRALNPKRRYDDAICNPTEELEIHNYTGICPTNVLEVSPSAGSCAVGCQYCLVTDGRQVNDITLFTNYCDKLAASLERNTDRALYYYFSPKTEAFSETHLFNGMAHNIMRTFAAHFKKHPDSRCRVFIATKAGPEHFNVVHDGETLFDIMGRIPDKIQVNGSVGIMPPYLRDILEPNAAAIEERMQALVEMRKHGILAESVLCQPLFLPYMADDTIAEYLDILAAAGVRNIKPEFFTAEIKNIVLVAQYVNHFDPDKLGALFYPYLKAENQTHIKQRSRLAPDRNTCGDMLAKIRKSAMERGITVSLCNWVKREVGGVQEWVRHIGDESAANGWRCLGYQTRLFDQ